MDNQNDMQSLSVKFYHYLADYVVGSEKVVKYRRYFYKCFDDFMDKGELRTISSGSKAEGLDLPGSDLDLMRSSYDYMVDEKIGNTKEKHLILDTDNALPGFALIKVTDESNFQLEEIYVAQTGNGLLLNNDSLKHMPFQSMMKLLSMYCMTDVLDMETKFKIQGPALSTVSKRIPDLDSVCCIPCREWPSIAKSWFYRNRCCNWPSSDLITEAMHEGVLLVPVGSKSTSNEENNFEWRFSFSLVEKLLVHSFNHSQLLCYALLKIFLKEIIEKKNMFSKLLCSYYMKTVIFWVLEEIDHSYWAPENLLRCFSLCLQRLHYFILCNYIPNYFIPEHNMIEGRFSDKVGKRLEFFIEKLLQDKIWKVLLSLDLFSELRHTKCYISKPLHVISEFDKTMITLKIPDCVQLSHDKSLNFFAYRIRNEYCPTFLKNIYAIALLDLCKSKAFSIKMRSVDSHHTRNKHYYSEYKQCLFHLLLNLNSDAVAGWLLLAAFFYTCQEYRKMNAILQLSEDIVSRDLYTLSHWFDVSAVRKIKFEKTIAISRHFLKRLRHSFVKLVFLKRDVLNDDSFIFHENLCICDTLFSIGTPIVFIRYLTFLYFHKQNNTEGMNSAFLLLQEAVERSPQFGVFSTIANFDYLLKAQLLIGVDQNETLKRIFTFLTSSDVTGTISDFEKKTLRLLWMDR